MRILITGGAGFIGSNLTRSMSGAGHQILVVDKLTFAGNLKSIADLLTTEKNRISANRHCQLGCHRRRRHGLCS